MSYLADKKVLVLVADAARARIFAAAEETDGLTEIETLVNGSAHLRGADLQSDRPGRSFDSGGSGRHGMAPSTDIKEQVAAQFAHDVARRMDELARATTYVNLVLIAAPAFLGQLRKSLKANTLNKVCDQIDKDLTGHTDKAIADAVTGAMRA